MHGEAGNDTVYTGAGNDIVFGDAQDDDLVGGWGNDWISGGTGADGILGDDGRIFTSRNTGCSTSNCWVAGSTAVYSEPLYGILALKIGDPDTRTSQGYVLDEYIYTPGQVQTSTINVSGQLAKAVDLSPYNLGPNTTLDGAGNHTVDQPLFDANNSDDIIFGGWDNDFIHGGAGDDAVSGSEALTSSYNVHFDDASAGSTGVDVIDWEHPYNPGDALHFGADTNPWHSNHHVAQRLGEFYLYDEYDPRRIILFNADGTVWKGGAAPTRQFFLNNDATLGHTVAACVAVDNQGNCTPVNPAMPTDGNDVLFGDLGNDWSVGGTGQDTIWAGWGNDLSNADDDLTTGTSYGLNDLPDGPNSSYQDRVYGGAGLDILIGNTGGDRLIDWVGEFNSYLVPFAPFGIATVSRQVEPQLPEFLYALSRSQGADPTRATDTGSDPARNGEPDGELGLITQHDHGQWQTQTGGPTDPQAGNIPGGKRDILRGADFNDGSMQAFAVDSGTWTVTGGKLTVAASSLGQDAVAVWYADAYRPIYYEINASIAMGKATGGWKANSFVIFDYWSPTDFKFAGIDDSINKMVVGHRDASGWWYDAQGPVNGSLSPGTIYQLLVAINGLNVTVSIGKQAFSYTFAPRVLPNGDQVALNKGMIGFGSNNSQSVLDNVSLQVLPPTVTLDRTEYFDDGVAGDFTGDSSGGWGITQGRYVGTSTVADPVAISTAVFAAHGFDPIDYVEVETTLRTGGLGGLVFDSYSTSDYKFVALDVPGQRVIVGHVDPRRGWVVEAAYARTLVAGTDYVLNLVLKGTVVTVTLNGSVLGSYVFNGAVADGQVGTLASGGAASFDRFRIRTDDEGFPVTPPAPEVRVGDASVTEGSSGQTAVRLTLTRTGDLTNAASVTWRTFDGTATAGSDYVAATGTATFAAGSSTTTVTVYVTGDTTYENNETFGVQILDAGGYNLADGFATVTVVNDDAKPSKNATAAISPTGTSPTTSSTGFASPDSTTTTSLKKGSFSATVTPDKGVYFNVTGGGNRTYLSVRITCDSGYSTVINVPLDADGNGTSVTVYPPPGFSCTATLEDQQAIGRSRVLATVTFTISCLASGAPIP